MPLRQLITLGLAGQLGLGLDLDLVVVRSTPPQYSSLIMFRSKWPWWSWLQVRRSLDRLPQAYFALEKFVISGEQHYDLFDRYMLPAVNTPKRMDWGRKRGSATLGPVRGQICSLMVKWATQASVPLAKHILSIDGHWPNSLHGSTNYALQPTDGQICGLLETTRRTEQHTFAWRKHLPCPN